jgi:hypothetical protein
MSAMTVLFFLIMIVLAAILGDHYSRLQKMGWAPEVEEYKQGRSLMDPIGGALGEVGRADLPYKVVAAGIGAVGTATGLVYAPIGMGLNAIGKATELVYKPIGMVLSLVAGAGRG